ncbi:unnamed protein product, partial [Ectocarpus fasciculatus]
GVFSSPGVYTSIVRYIPTTRIPPYQQQTAVCTTSSPADEPSSPWADFSRRPISSARPTDKHIINAEGSLCVPPSQARTGASHHVLRHVDTGSPLNHPADDCRLRSRSSFAQEKFHPRGMLSRNNMSCNSRCPPIVPTERPL